MRDWGALLGMLAVVASLHAAFVVPAVLNESRKMVLEEIDRDGRYRNEIIEALRSQLQSLATRESIHMVQRELADIKTRLSALENRK